MAIVTNNKAKYVGSPNLSKVLKKQRNSDRILQNIACKWQIVCFTGCGEAGKQNDKASNAERVKPNKGVQQPKQKDNDRIIINIARKEFKKRSW